MAEPLAELVRTFRSAARLSQEALAERAGISTRTVGDIETGFARTPRLVTVMLLAEALELGEPDRTRLREAARKTAARPTAGSAPTLTAPRLIGREADVEALSALVTAGDVRIVTLCGPAGVGKTSLALRVAADCAARFAHGAAVVELATVVDPALVPATVARALGVGADHDPDALIETLAGRHLLLVLDTLEHLTPCAAWIASLCENAPRLCVLATSREGLRLRAERLYAVQPLGQEAAAQLFVQRAQSVQPGFALEKANAAAVSAIVERLEGLPLAIELAAPRLRLLPPKALAARLDRRLPMLDDGAVDLPRRQQTMRSAIAWSYDLLEPDEQCTFRRLAVLSGGGSLEAARAVVGETGPQQRALLHLLAALVDKSLLRLEEDDDGEPRVAMLDMLREYAYEQLEQSDELVATRRRQALDVLDFARIAEKQLVGEHQARWLRRLEREHANVRAALSWALERDNAEFGLELAASVWRLWWMRGYLVEGSDWLRRLLDLAQSTGPVPERLLAKALRALVVLLSALGNFDEALPYCEEAVRLQRKAGDDAGLGGSLTSLGIIWQFRGDPTRARTVHEESLAIRRRIGDELGTATSLSNLSSIAFTEGALEQAQTFAQESVAIYRRLGHSSGLSHALTKLGLVAAHRKDFDLAERLFEEALRLQRSVGSTGSEHYALTNLAAVAQKRGDVDRALVLYREALDLLRTVRNKHAIAVTLEGFAESISAAGDPHRAARIFGAASALRTGIGSPRFPSERLDYAQAIDATKRAIGDAAFDVEWQLGACRTLEQALEETRASAQPA